MANRFFSFGRHHPSVSARIDDAALPTAGREPDLPREPTHPEASRLLPGQRCLRRQRATRSVGSEVEAGWHSHLPEIQHCRCFTRSNCRLDAMARATSWMSTASVAAKCRPTSRHSPAATSGFTVSTSVDAFRLTVPPPCTTGVALARGPVMFSEPAADHGQTAVAGPPMPPSRVASP
jgi:hypothetical protein